MKNWLRGLGEAGWIADQDRFELPPNAITDLQNFRMRNGWAEKVKGYRQVFDSLGAPVRFLTPFLAADNDRYIVTCTANAVYADDGSARTPITPSGALSSVTSNAWTAAVMNGVLGLCNGTDKPMYWNGSGVLADLPDWGTNDRAKALCQLKYHWVALNITKSGTNYPHRVKISAAAEPGSPGTDWDHTDPTNDAYEFDVEGDGSLVWGLPFGDGLMLYTDTMCHLLRYTGDTEFPWAAQPMPHLPFGMLAVNCGVVVPGVGHVVLTKDDVIAHDGQTARSVLDGSVKQWLVDNLDPDHYAASYVVADHQKGEVQICIPERGHEACTKAILWNWRTGMLGKKDLPDSRCGCRASFNYVSSDDSFDGDSVTFDSESTLTFNDTTAVFAANESRVLMGGDGGKVFVMDSTDTADGASMTGYIELGALCNFVPELKGQWQLLSEVWLEVDAADGAVITVTPLSATDGNDAFTSGTAFTFTVGTHKKADVFACSPFPGVKFSSTSWFRVRTIAPQLDDEGEY